MSLQDIKLHEFVFEKQLLITAKVIGCALQTCVDNCICFSLIFVCAKGAPHLQVGISHPAKAATDKALPCTEKQAQQKTACKML